MQDNADVERLSRAYGALNDGGVTSLSEVLAPHVRWLESPPAVMPERLRRDELVERLGELGWDEWRFEPHDFSVSGRRLVVAVRETLGDQTRRRGHYWEMSDEGAVRLEVHRWPVDAITAGHGYFALLEDMHERLRPRTYAEIGVYTGRSLARARPGTKLVGIDPKPLVVDPAVEAVARIFRMTSDEFFERHDLKEVLGGLPVDLAFIDGMHLFEFVLRDFMNLERNSGEKSVILIHDTAPPDSETAQREAETPGWTGDVWKIIPCLREFRPDLQITAIDVPPGMTMVEGLDPTSGVLAGAYDEILARYVPMRPG